ncbi:MAG: sugar phosphate isomerase/epimerase family protein [Gemmatales bacterium]|nr:sugar phosphate isomerase/epimerase [Gemmatales bacterium]MDW7995267.1 sugar phosphate isomerase/epimerase family protein [Gemmatales bacterium]
MNRREFVATGLAGLSVLGISSKAAWSQSPNTSLPPARFQLGIVTYNIAATWDLPTILRVCRNVGLSAVELRTTHAHGVEPDLPPAKRAEVRKQFADSGIVFWGSGTVCEFHSPDASVVRRNIEICKRFVDLVADLGGKGVKVRPNALPKEVPIEKTLEQIGKALRECGKSAADRGIEIWLEVHGPGTSHPPHVRTIMEHCGAPNVGITWNSNQSDIKDGSVREYFELLRPWLKSCHINELYSNYPWRELFGLLRQCGYDRYTLAEIPGMPDVASGERLLRYYKALWQELIG